jgi:hypothetical protein
VNVARLRLHAAVASSVFGAMAVVACVQAVYPPSSPDAAHPNTRPVVGISTDRQPPADPPCDHDVPVLDARAPAPRAYDVVAMVSVTCGVGLAQSCDDRLRARACRDGADAVVVDADSDETHGAQPSKSARLVRWRAADAGPG